MAGAVENDCPSDEAFGAYVNRELAEDRRAVVEKHVDGCPSCRELLGILARSLGGDGDARNDEEEQEHRVGRFVVEREVGAGAMGIVYRAYDPSLRRAVALKVLRPDADALASKDGDDRLVSEAQAMARLAHPNVATVYEVGTVGDQVFIAMEFVDGGLTLRHWLSQRSRTWDEIVSMFAHAGRGLAAAHASRLVHRDFKPENVLIGEDGRPRVTDFGLARADRIPADRVDDEDDNDATLPRTRRALTETGMLVGTPAYMSPEQHLAGTATAASDQYAFCVALFEALYGDRPVAGSSLLELRKNSLAGELLPRPDNSDVPARVHHLLERGLSVDQDERFDSMSALVDELEQAVEAFRRLEGQGASPFPGLSSFAEGDAERFFGRTAEVARLRQRLEDSSVVGLVGPSGVGKSSLIRAGLIPSLRSDATSWRIITLRPGRDPLGGLVRGILRSYEVVDADVLSMADVLRDEPEQIREYTHRSGRDQHILVFVDQFEELFTLCDDRQERGFFLSVLGALTSSASQRVKVVLSIRSDQLDRVVEHPLFADELSRGLMFLGQPNRQGLRDALVRPLEGVGYHFESDRLVERLLDELEGTTGVLPLLQFAGATLWHLRDRVEWTITEEAYESMGTVAGALARHADEVLGGQLNSAQVQIRRLFQRLVTPQRTRAILSLGEAIELLGPGSSALVEELARARLLVVQRDDTDGDATVELIHESLISSWPTLQRWLDEDAEDAVFLGELRTAARQWDNRGRAPGLLWTGDSAIEARLWRRRHEGPLGRLEEQYLDAVIDRASASARRKRVVVLGIIGTLVLAVAAATVGLLVVRRAERERGQQAVRAEAEAARARAAEADKAAQLEEIQRENRRRRVAEDKAAEARAQAAAGQVELEGKEAELAKALDGLKAQYAHSQAATRQARAAELAASKANKELKKLLAQERERVRKLQRRKGQLVNDLKELDRKP